jgi:CRISPR-associated protein Cmr2
MRERVKRYFTDFEKAFLNLKEAVTIAKTDLGIDGTIKRFELCYELSWKLIKEYLADKGLIVKNPRDTFREAVKNGIIENEEGWMEMIEDRNFLVHTYSSEESRTVYERIKSTYIKLFESLYKKIKEEFKMKNNFEELLKRFLHDPIDKCFEIQTHEKRSQEYADKVGISGLEDAKGSDQIASCMERSLLPKEKVYQKFNEIKHPLCEGELKLDTSESVNDEVFNLVESVFLKLNISEYEDKNKFFYLWRNLEDEIFEESLKEGKHKEWIRYLPILPADTRISDHSIWEHLKIASAVNAFWDNENKILHQSNSLFLFTIGPVQSFISQARKTQDFFMGSFMLSYLTFIAMKEIINDFGPTSIIYPDLYKQPLVDWFLKNELNITIKNSYSSYVDLPTIPNRFVAIIPETDEKELKEIAEKMKNKIKNEINQAKEKILEDLKINLTEDQKSLFEKHLANFPEIYWVAVPWKLENKDVTIDDLKDFFEENEIKKLQEIWDFAQKNGENPPNIGLLYQPLYTALEKSLGSRKNLREFNYFEEKGRKCSLCGERNVLFFREEKNPQKFLRYNPEAINVKDIKNFPLKYLADGEGLCGLCFIKRTFDIIFNL